MDTTIWCMILGPIIVIIAIFVSAGAKRNATEEARQQYLRALQTLKANPTDATQKQQTLALGRKYSNLTRNKRGVTIFDEMALMNDLNAATAHAHVAPAMPVQQPALSVADRLRKLEDLRLQGLVSDQEFANRRAKIPEDV